MITEKHCFRTWVSIQKEISKFPRYILSKEMHHSNMATNFQSKYIWTIPKNIFRNKVTPLIAVMIFMINTVSGWWTALRVRGGDQGSSYPHLGKGIKPQWSLLQNTIWEEKAKQNTQKKRGKERKQTTLVYCTHLIDLAIFHLYNCIFAYL